MRYPLLQGVSQYFGHLANCNFSAFEAPRIKILDIFEKPGQFWFQNYPYFEYLVKICQSSAAEKMKTKIIS